MLVSAAGVAFTPTLRPHAARPSARAAVVCGLDAPLPPAAVVNLEATTRQAASQSSVAGAADVLPSQNIFPTDLLAAQLFGQGKEFTGYKVRNKGVEPTADLEPTAKPDYNKYEDAKPIDLSSYFEEKSPADDSRTAKAKEEAAPAAETPSFEMPKFDTPSISMPKFDTSAFSAPSIPKFDAPKFDAPKFDAPKFDAPKFDAPKFDAPKFDAPKFDAPKFDAPKFDAP
eukprot:CAMPEP_0119056486 /NCGR_PEP_ID=MMETSP1178-20130426/1130_1 /TAXON_ID=33656 /ORGANISM="unid sp, Strain CCMP2000" /LENGTH=227 /DNA_ID=CAMNT_0007037217 /DNA_START=36 /DNA_END=716 /DNA_ORIENTATION=+